MSHIACCSVIISCQPQPDEVKKSYLSKILFAEYFKVRFQGYIGVNSVRCLRHRYFFVESTAYKRCILSGCRTLRASSGIICCNTRPSIPNRVVLIDGKAIVHMLNFGKETIAFPLIS